MEGDITTIAVSTTTPMTGFMSEPPDRTTNSASGYHRLRPRLGLTATAEEPSMKTALVSLIASVAVMASVMPASAHHAFAAEFDRDRPITLTGTVTKLEWTNPHARIYIDVKDDKGNTVNWDFELGPPNGLMRRGWNRNSLRQGHVVTIEGFLSKLAPRVANARTVKLPDGRQVFAGSSFDTGPAGDESPAK
jgi:hypothetical protein